MLYGLLAGIVIAAIFLAIIVWRAMPVGIINARHVLAVMLASIVVCTAAGGFASGW